MNCAWCDFYIVVNQRGARWFASGTYLPGSGEEAADLMRGHVNDVHSKTWDDYLEEMPP